MLLLLQSTNTKGRIDSGLAIDDGLQSSIRLNKGMRKSSRAVVGSVKVSEKRGANREGIRWCL